MNDTTETLTELNRTEEDARNVTRCDRDAAELYLPITYTITPDEVRDAAHVDYIMTKARSGKGTVVVRYWDETSDPANPGWVVRTYEDGEIVDECLK